MVEWMDEGIAKGGDKFTSPDEQILCWKLGWDERGSSRGTK